MSKKLLDVIAHKKPLEIGNMTIDCYVLEGERRVLSQRSLISGLGLRSGGGSSGATSKIPRFFTSNRLKPFISEKVKNILENPFLFKSPTNGSTTFGYDAAIFPELCIIIIKADNAGIWTERDRHIVERAEVFTHGLALVGIIARIDEATGYQDFRREEELKEIFDKFLDNKARPWAKIFPLEFYSELYRLNGWVWKTSQDGKKPATPSVVGTYTNNFIYNRLIPGFPEELTAELDRLNPKNNVGNRQWNHHQWIEEHKALPYLQKHIHSIIAIMRGYSSMSSFERHIKRAFPMTGDQDEMEFDED